MITLLVSVLIFTGIIGTVATKISDTGVNGNGANITGGALALYSIITLIVVALFVVTLTKHFKGKK